MTSRLAAAAVLAWSLGVAAATSADAQGSLTVACVPSSPTVCVATVPLTSNMDVNLTLTFPPNDGFNVGNDNGTGPYGIMPPGGYSSGIGSSWTAVLTTDTNEPAGAVAVFTVTITPLSSSTTIPSKKLPAPINVAFAPNGWGLSAGAKAQLAALAKKVKVDAHVTFTGYAKSDYLVARNRARSAADYFYSRVNVYWTIVTNTTKALNRVTVTVIAQ